MVQRNTDKHDASDAEDAPRVETRVTAFGGGRCLVVGTLAEAAVAATRAAEQHEAASVLLFDDTTGHVIDVDLRGTEAEIAARYASPAASPSKTRRRGRPTLGVVGREVTLLPRHWDWLNAQPGGASVALRKLVDQARKAGGERERRREAQQRAYRVLAALAGDLPGFEEGSRALFADDLARLEAIAADWPPDVAAYVLRLALE